MNLRYDRIAAWAILFIMVIMLSICAIGSTISNNSNETPVSSIEESNISIPEIKIEEMVSEEESVVSEEESEIIEPSLPSIEEEIPIVEEKLPAANLYIRYLGDNETQLKTEKKFCQEEIDKRVNIINESKELDYYDTENEYFKLLEQDIVIYTEHRNYYEEKLQEVYSSIKITQSVKVNPQAAKEQIWIMLRAKGFNEYVTAGIMGNIQAECGFKWNVYSAGGESYGICQWLLKYVPEISGASLEEQIDYLLNGKYNMKSAFNSSSYNKNYKNINYEQFINLQDEREAAAAFMLIYERPASKDPTKRSNYATEIYKEFVG